MRVLRSLDRVPETKLFQCRCATRTRVSGIGRLQCKYPSFQRTEVLCGSFVCTQLAGKSAASLSINVEYTLTNARVRLADEFHKVRFEVNAISDYNIMRARTGWKICKVGVCVYPTRYPVELLTARNQMERSAYLRAEVFPTVLTGALNN